MVDHKPWNYTLKGFYLIVLMALVDADYWFVLAAVGAPGNTHYSTLLQSNDLLKRIVGVEMIPNVVQQVEDVELLPFTLDGRAYPLWTFMMKLHGDAKLPDDKQYFNYRYSQARLVTEGTFRRLKTEGILGPFGQQYTDFGDILFWCPNLVSLGTIFFESKHRYFWEIFFFFSIPSKCTLLHEMLDTLIEALTALTVWQPYLCRKTEWQIQRSSTKTTLGRQEKLFQWLLPPKSIF